MMTAIILRLWYCSAISSIGTGLRSRPKYLAICCVRGPFALSVSSSQRCTCTSIAVTSISAPPFFQRQSKIWFFHVNAAQIRSLRHLFDERDERIDGRDIFADRAGGAHRGDLFLMQQPAEQQFLVRDAGPADLLPHFVQRRLRRHPLGQLLRARAVENLILHVRVHVARA